MPYRNIRKIDVTDKKSPEFDHWLKTNISDRGYRSWYRADSLARSEWLNKLETDINREKVEKARLEKWKARF